VTKKQVWIQTNLAYWATTQVLWNASNEIVADAKESRGRVTFNLRDLLDVTFQITTKGKLSIAYPEETEYIAHLNKVKPFLRQIDGSIADQFEITYESQKRVKEDIKLGTYRAPHLHMQITQQIQGTQSKRILPSVGFTLANPNDYPIKIKIEARQILGKRNLGFIKDRKGYYSGKRLFNLNPGTSLINGNFTISKECIQSTEELSIEITSTIVGPDNQEYKRLPESWTFMRDSNTWYYEPSTLTASQ
jgi:hypothetical protein